MSPEKYGVSSEKIENYLKMLNEKGFAMHSVLMSVDGNVFFEAYWKPFSKDSLQRMNSVSKSFITAAIGILEEEGRLSLDDKLYTYFPEIEAEKIPPRIREVSIRDVLIMKTASKATYHWVGEKRFNRIEDYFSEGGSRLKNTVFDYDSYGSYILGVIVERICKKPFLEFLKERVFSKTGFFKNADCIKTPEGYSWGDSGILCTLRDLHSYALLVMNEGEYNGQQLINKRFMQDAVKKHSDTNKEGWQSHKTFGYGYQIWKTYEDGFAFLGMGDQLVICIPKRRFIFACTADNQGCGWSREFIVDFLYNDIIKNISDKELAPNPDALRSLEKYASSMELVSLKGEITSSYCKEIDNKLFVMEENPMGIKNIKLSFSSDEGFLEYENTTGRKVLNFGLCKNVYTRFPEKDVCDTVVGEKQPGNMFLCASSGAWMDEKTFCIKAQMIEKHLGGLFIIIAFSDNGAGMEIVKNTNCFLDDYSGFAGSRVCLEDNDEDIK